MFLHGSWMHIIGNMWTLWIFDDNMEDRMGPIRFLQVDNLIPIVLSRERSVIRGIRGMGGLSGFMECLSRVDRPCIAAVWNRTLRLGSSKYRSGCSNQAPVAECTVRRTPRLSTPHCRI